MDIKDISSLIDDERKPFKIYLKKRGSKRLTVIEGLPNQKSYLKDFKWRYACNGFLDMNINLQGDHREEISKYFLKEKILHHIIKKKTVYHWAIIRDKVINISHGIN